MSTVSAPRKRLWGNSADSPIAPAPLNSPLIEPNVLARQLNNHRAVIVDCRFDLIDPGAGRTAYRHGHIPGARYAHLDNDLARVPGPADGRHPLPRAQDFADTLRSWGISKSCSVIVYDDVSGAIAARLWWMMRWVGHESVYVLNGGFQGWKDAGLPLEYSEPRVHEGRFVVDEVRHDWIVPTERIPSELANGAVLVDARSRGRYQGIAEPIDPVAGHVPGAVNFPFSDVLQGNGRLRPAKELHENLRHLVDGPRGLIAMCGSGVTACHLLLATSTAGLGDGRVYVGSWSEWIRDPERPIATGAGP